MFHHVMHARSFDRTISRGWGYIWGMPFLCSAQEPILFTIDLDLLWVGLNVGMG